MLRSLLTRIDWVLWVALLLLLPITSLPLASKLGGSAMVAPAPVIPLFLLVLAWFLPHLWRGEPLPLQSKPLMVFTAAAILSSLAAYFHLFPLFRELNFTGVMLQAGITLAIGLCMYLVAATFPADDSQLGATLRWINWTGLAILAWSLAQRIAYRDLIGYPAWMSEFQKIFSITRLFDQRVTGFAFEPSWLAHQLNMLYLPLWLAASLRGFSAHRRRLWGITFENVLLVGGIAVLWFSLSRVGLLAFLLSLGYLLVRANLWLLETIKGWLARRSKPPQSLHRLGNALLTGGLVVLFLLVYAGLFLAAAGLLSRLDPRMAGMFNFSTLLKGEFMEYANQLVFAERIVFWQVGWEVFNDFPVLGVGLGNAGYFFVDKLSPFGWGLTEPTQIIYLLSYLPNTKSLWARLLAETGLVGFSFFLSWCVALWFSLRSLDRRTSPIQRMLGLAGRLVLVGLLIEGFSIDTFALPYFWLTLGLATAAWRIR